MPATALTVQDATLFGGDEITFAAVDQPNGNSIPADPNIVVLVKRGAASSDTATMTSTASENERTGDIVATLDAIDEIGILAPTRPTLFSQKSGADIGKILLAFGDTDWTVAAVRIKQ